MDEQMIERIAEALWRAEWAVGHEPAYSWDVLCAEDESIADAFRAQARAAHSVMSERMAELEEALKPFADQMTTAELLHNPDRSELTPEHRIERMGERKRERDANILRARAALAPHPKAYCGIVEVNEEDFRAGNRARRALIERLARGGAA